jgi:Fe-S cluster assembly ATPase SufC
MNKMLEINDLRAEIGGKQILNGLALSIGAGAVQKLLGISLEGSVG